MNINKYIAPVPSGFIFGGISYEKYTPVNGVPKVGDIIRAETGYWKDVSRGDYFVIADDDDDDETMATFYDNEGDPRHLDDDDTEYFSFYRTSELYEKIEKSEALGGDFVCINDDVVPNFIIPGKMYRIIEIDGAGDAQIIDEDGERFDTFNRRRSYFRLSTKAPQPAKPTLTAGSRALYNGNAVRIEEANPSEAPLQIVDSNALKRWVSEDSLTPIIPFKEGDRVRLIEDCNDRDFTAGTIGKIDIVEDEDYLGRSPYRFCKDGGGVIWIGWGSAELVTDEEVSVTNSISIEVGDIVMYSGRLGFAHGAEGYEGIICEIESVTDRHAVLKRPSFIRNTIALNTPISELTLICKKADRKDIA